MVEKYIFSIFISMTTLLKNIIFNHSHPSKLDIIGDVHGHADELEALLTKLGYQYNGNYWHHQTFKAVFVGDFINRGPFNRKVIQIVRAMVENKAGYAILGNHEINVISYFLKKKNGLPYRIPGPTNRKYMNKIKSEYINEEAQFKVDIKWLRTLPLFYDFKRVRIVHAYWNDQHIELIKGAISKGKLTRKLLKEISKGMSQFSKAILQTTRGVEYCFPPNMIVKDITKRRKVCFRVKWWVDPYNKTYEELKYETKSHLPDIPIPYHLITPYEIYPSDAPPVFVGHYCMNQGEMIPVPNICCVDSCVANRGKLTAYRWQGEQQLSKSNLVSVNKIQRNKNMPISSK